jgi:hypothetical protein
MRSVMGAGMRSMMRRRGGEVRGLRWNGIRLGRRGGGLRAWIGFSEGAHHLRGPPGHSSLEVAKKLVFGNEFTGYP